MVACWACAVRPAASSTADAVRIARVLFIASSCRKFGHDQAALSRGFVTEQSAPANIPRRSRHVADRLDFEGAIHRSAAGLHARARRQRLLAGEIAAIDAVELFRL